jgi:Tfp pilus assembly protein PilV
VGRPTEGYALLEALLALAILSVAAVGMLEVRANAARNAAESRNGGIAAIHAARLLSEVLMDPGEGEAALRPLDGQPGFAWRVVRMETSLGAVGAVQKVRVEVHYQSSGASAGQAEVVALETLAAPAGEGRR